MSSRISCWFHGHIWGKWDSRVWENVIGTVEYKVRWCTQCGAVQKIPYVY